MVLARRRTELLLLALPIAFLALALVALADAMPETRAAAATVTIVFALLFIGGHAALVVLCPEADETLLPVVAMLSAIGIAFAMRLDGGATALARKQLIWLALGLALMAATVGLLRQYTLLRRYKYLAAVCGLGLMAVTAVGGRQINGSRLWLGAGGYYFQVTEALKLLLIIFLAGYLADKRYMLAAATTRWRRFRVPTLPYLLPLAVIWGLTLALMAWQHDLGAMLLLMAVTLLMLYVATARRSFVLAGGVLVILNLWIAYHVFGYVRVRIDLWLHPLTRVHDQGYQVAQALYAFAGGGVLGTGIGHGFPNYIPVVQTDFIFAAIGEELGAAGALAILGIYLVLALRGLRIGVRQPADFGTLLAVGVTAILALQALIIVAGNLALVPITGITLPWVSYGGSSVVVNFVLLGLLLRLSTSRPAPVARQRGGR
jgi:cell division protein FtsW (lipid II flippase)